MVRWLNQLFDRPKRRARNRCAAGHPVAGFVGESLERRELLAVAGVETSVSSLFVRESTPAAFTVNWQPTGEGSADSAGMNLRIHYDSSALDFVSVADVHQPGLTAQQDTTEASDRDDGDAATDRVNKTLWYDIGGAWPSISPASQLVTINFTTKPGFVETVVNIDATTVADTPLPRQQVTITQDRRPVLTGPAATNVTPRPTVTWDAVAGATSYEVWVKNLSSGVNPYLRETVTTNSFTPGSDLDLGRYRVWVEATFADSSTSGWSEQRTFEVKSRVTGLGPTGTVNTSRPTIDWDPLDGAHRYDVWINNVTTGESQVVRDEYVFDDEYTVPSDLPLGEYLVWVRGINFADFPGTWSTAARMQVKTPPTLIAPVNPTFDTTPTFQWTAVPGADEYDLWVRNLTTGQDQVIRQPALTTLEYTPSVALPEATYLWWVQARSDLGPVSTWGGGRFSIGGVPVLLAPTGSTTDRTPVFLWSEVGGGVQQYDLWVDRIGGPAQIIRQPTLLTNTFTPSTDLPTGTYRFWVRALSTEGVWSLWSAEQQFTIT